MRQIEAYPQAWPTLNVPGAADGIVRHLPVPPFPHSVVYVAQPHLAVIAIASGRRRPQYWVKRLRKVQWAASSLRLGFGRTAHGALSSVECVARHVRVFGAPPTGPAAYLR